MVGITRAIRVRHTDTAMRERLIKRKCLRELGEAIKFSRDELALYLHLQDRSELLRRLTRGVSAFSRNPRSPDMHGQRAQSEQADVVKPIFARAEKNGVDMFEALNAEVAHDPALGHAIVDATFE